MTIVIAAFLFLLGAIFASFTTVIAERVYTGQSWMRGRSRCNSCRRTLSVIDLVPVVSLIAFRGRCRTCRARIPLMYSFLEAVLGIVFVWGYLSLGLTLSLGLFLLTTTVLLFIVVYDLRHMVVTWWSSVLLLVLGAAFAIVRAAGAHLSFVQSTQQLGVVVAVALIIGLFFFSMHYFSKGRWMGLGDAPVAIALSLLVGAAAVPGLLFSFWIGAAIGIGLLLLRRKSTTMSSEVPFVPFLALGYLLAFFTQWNPLL
jgi:prepilin signal peptidase PulO-like enzyme (type II secretory pathway)